MNPNEEEIIQEVFADAADKGEGEQDTIVLVADVLEGLDSNGDES